MSDKITWVECPRDAMQGWNTPIPTEVKTDYLNLLLKVGFDTLDFGSFVSPKAIPQLADTARVLEKLAWEQSKTKLLAIVANKRGAQEAVSHDGIQYIGFPFSISETFQKLNTNSSMEESLSLMSELQELASLHKKEVVTYISMGFGNPYGDPYNPEIAIEWVGRLAALGLRIFALSDTVGMADTEGIRLIFSHLIKHYPDLEFGAHFHATTESIPDKLAAAWDSGCRRFDSAMGGIGGCPMAQNELVGNLASESFLAFLDKRDIDSGIDRAMWNQAQVKSRQVFI